MKTPPKVEIGGKSIPIDLVVFISGTKNPLDDNRFHDDSFGPHVKLPMPLLSPQSVQEMVSVNRWKDLNPFHQHLYLLTTGHPRRIERLQSAIAHGNIPKDPTPQNIDTIQQTIIDEVSLHSKSIDFPPEVLQ